MLPPGHIAAGYLTGYALLKILKPDISLGESQELLMWAAFFGFVPDVDFFLAFAKEKALTIRDFEKNNHRRFLTHAPILWLIAGLLIYFFASSPFYKILGLLLWTASWSHFVFDSIEYGVRWVWPFNNTAYSLKPGVNVQIKETSFFGYWLAFLKFYSKSGTFYLEIVVIIIALTVFLNH